jgi:cytochrome c biogenesis protein CcmG, thiol:disulfide interchange protein DsbE
LPSTSSSEPADLRSRRALLALAAIAVVALVAGATAWVVVDAEHDDSAASQSSSHCKVELPADAGTPTAGSTPPTFVLRALDGACVDLTSYRGRPVIVNFWASWCNPCRDEFPMFRTARAKHASEGLEILGIVHNDIPGDARQFARQQNADWPLLLDGSNAVADAYGIVQIPQTFFIRRDGTISAHLFGLSRHDFEVELQRILADGA